MPAFRPKSQFIEALRSENGRHWLVTLPCGYHIPTTDECFRKLYQPLGKEGAKLMLAESAEPCEPEILAHPNRDAGNRQLAAESLPARPVKWAWLQALGLMPRL